MRNPFRNPKLAGQYENMIKAHDQKHRDLIRPSGARHNGNTLAMWFWRGYDGVGADRFDRAFKETFTYACWCAGRDVRARDSK